MQSDLGLVDVSVDAQIDEIGNALLGDRQSEPVAAEVSVDR